MILKEILDYIMFDACCQAKKISVQLKPSYYGDNEVELECPHKFPHPIVY